MDLRVTSAEDFIIKLASPYLFIFKCDFDFLQILRLVGLGVEKIDASNQWSYVRTVHTGRRQAGRKEEEYTIHTIEIGTQYSSIYWRKRGEEGHSSLITPTQRRRPSFTVRLKNAN